MAAVGTGVLADLGEASAWIDFSRKVTPRREHKERYDALYAIFRDLYSQTSSLMKNISAVQQENIIE